MIFRETNLLKLVIFEVVPAGTEIQRYQSSHCGRSGGNGAGQKEVQRRPKVDAVERGHDISRTVQVTSQEQDMNAPPKIDPVTAHSDGDVVHWLTNGTRDERFIDNIFAELCVRLQRAGIPVKRATLHLLIYHPQWIGPRVMWADGMREAELARVDYD